MNEIGRATSRKLGVLRDILADCESICLGYSGGVDSVFLARAIMDVLPRDRFLAVMGISAAVPAEQRNMARGCAERFGFPYLEVVTDELADPDYAANPSNRCYFCKSELWRVLSVIAAERSLASLVDGSNADDATDYRPGTRAGREKAVRSPLQEAGLTKAEIREASRAYDLPTWDQPSSPCLSSRLPYGLAVTVERLGQVESAEREIRSLGFQEFRVRHHDNAARLEFGAAEIERAAARFAEITARVKAAGFSRALLDVEGYRRGALNEGLPLVQLQAVR